MSNTVCRLLEEDQLARSLAKRFGIPSTGIRLIGVTHGGYQLPAHSRTVAGGHRSITSTSA